ncbi:MAG: hypothetical protein ABSB89_09195 [Candidatus Bathyarchaeia archaeon]|jgi:hypothetical protein
MNISRIWEIVTSFKQFCRLRGWRTSENEDWVELDNEYHNFLSAKNVNPASFKTIITNRKCIVHKGLLYTVVEQSHQAWLFSEPPSQDMYNTVLKKPDYSKNIALFDLSSVQHGKNKCIKLNNTDSPVFHEFETYLQNELKIEIQSYQAPLDTEITLTSNTLSQLA